MGLPPFFINAYFIVQLIKYVKTLPPPPPRNDGVQSGENEQDRPLINDGELINESVNSMTEQGSEWTVEGTLITPQPQDQDQV